MEKVLTEFELFDHIGRMSRTNSVSQVFIPGKGTFTMLLQEEDPLSLNVETALDPRLHEMIQDSRDDYKSGNVLTTKQFLQSISPADFKK
ncbi:hypothetical protein [Cohnella luojiensis]|uniref:Uncharacterized protein n=1 Tax=Cohnella luojiensis TaxID=652876 RepID=A0A4Y8LPD8_9BACL|nr:hypothetical protein [Cohnella luojiensis]TFE22783.1 hypothetical protein E2980_20540 [Cohnella luojiensis]